MTNCWWVLCGLVPCASFLAFGCGGDDGRAPTGTTISSPDGVVTIAIPEGALPDGMAASDIRITPLDDPPSRRLNVTAEQALAGEWTEADEVPPVLAYRLEPEGATFAAPLIATVRVDSASFDGGGTFTLASEGSFESLAIADLRAAPEATEVDVEIPHFSTLEVWGPALVIDEHDEDPYWLDPFVTFEWLTPADGAMLPVDASFSAEVQLTRAAEQTRGYVTYRAVGSERLGTLIIQRSLAREWSIQGTLSSEGALVRGEDGHAWRSVSEDATTETFSPACDSAEGPGHLYAAVRTSVVAEVVTAPIEGVLPGEPGPPRLENAHDFHYWTRHVECVAAPASPCADLLGDWSAAASFVARPNECGYGDFTDTLRLTIDPDGTVTIEQPATMDVNTGTASGACHLETMSADGRESYTLDCDGASRTCTGVNEYTNTMGCSVVNDVTFR